MISCMVGTGTIYSFMTLKLYIDNWSELVESGAYLEGKNEPAHNYDGF